MISPRRIVAGAGQVALFVLGGDKKMKRFVAKALDARRTDGVRSTYIEKKKRFRL